MRDALLALATTVTDTRKAFGTKDEVDPVQRLIGAASAWGANAPKDAIYLNFVPEKNDGKTIYKLHVKDVPSGQRNGTPVKGRWGGRLTHPTSGKENYRSSSSTPLAPARIVPSP